MKKIIGIVISVASLFGCGSKHGDVVSVPNESAFDSISLSQEDNFNRGLKVVGKFDGNKTDTLICEPIDTTIADKDEWSWKITSINGTTKPLVINRRYSVRMVFEGDLDQNGTDEFGIRREISHGTWDCYFIYTYDGGDWKYLTEPIFTYSSHFYDELNCGKDVAEPTNIKDVIRIKQSETTQEGDIIIKDTLVKAKIHKDSTL